MLKLGDLMASRSPEAAVFPKLTLFRAARNPANATNDQLADLLDRRMTAFDTDIQSLAEDFIQRGLPARPKARPENPPAIDRIIELTHAGKARAAMTVVDGITPQGVMQPSAEIINKLRTLHPQRRSTTETLLETAKRTPDGSVDMPPCPTISSDKTERRQAKRPSRTEALTKAVTRLRYKSASGPSALAPSTLKRGAKLAPRATTRVLHLAWELLDTPEEHWLKDATLVPLSKPNKGVRPIAIGETLRRVVANAALMQWGSEGTKAVPHSQTAMVGCVPAVIAIQTALREAVDGKRGRRFTTIQLDGSNAFNEESRDLILAVSEARLPKEFNKVVSCAKGLPMRG